MEQIQNGIPAERNIRRKNKRTLGILILTIAVLILISVVYIIIYPKL